MRRSPNPRSVKRLNEATGRRVGRSIHAYPSIGRLAREMTSHIERLEIGHVVDIGRCLFRTYGGSGQFDSLLPLSDQAAVYCPGLSELDTTPVAVRRLDSV
jgi:hypothetical protein